MILFEGAVMQERIQWHHENTLLATVKAIDSIRVGIAVALYLLYLLTRIQNSFQNSFQN